MRHRSALVLPALALAGGGVLATGFPARTGLTRSQAAVSLPGDLVLPGATVIADRATLNSAPAERIWPWLTQLGQDRGGFYSFTALENAAGCGITDVRELRPEWSRREVGDRVALAPGLALRVAVSSEFDALVLTSEGGEKPSGSAGSSAMDVDLTWTFALLPETRGHTRLHVRERYVPHTRAADASCRATLVASAIMTRRMLHTVKALAEAH